MYYLQIESLFEAAHKLIDYKGKCANVHGHNFKILVELKSPQLDELGMVEDFIEFEKKLNHVTDKLDHKMLNEIPPFDKINPTSERLAEFIYEELDKIYVNNVSVNKVTVYENDRYAAAYCKE